MEIDKIERRDREKDMEEEGGAQREGGPVINYLAYPTSPRNSPELHLNRDHDEPQANGVVSNCIQTQRRANAI